LQKIQHEAKCAACFPFEPLEKCMTFNDILPGLSSISRTKVIFQDFPGPGIFKKKIPDFPGLSRRRGKPDLSNSIDEEPQPNQTRTLCLHNSNRTRTRFLKSTRNPNRTEPLSSKYPNQTQTENFAFFPISKLHEPTVLLGTTASKNYSHDAEKNFQITLGHVRSLERIFTCRMSIFLTPNKQRCHTEAVNTSRCTAGF